MSLLLNMLSRFVKAFLPMSKCLLIARLFKNTCNGHTWGEELTHLKRSWCWERLKAGGEGDNRGWDCWMALLTQWTWVWVGSGSWWWTGRPGVLQFMESRSQTQLSKWTELNWGLKKKSVATFTFDQRTAASQWKCHTFRDDPIWEGCSLKCGEESELQPARPIKSTLTSNGMTNITDQPHNQLQVPPQSQLLS